MSTCCYKDSSKPVEKRIKDLIGRMTVEEKLGQLNQIYRGSDNPLPAEFAIQVRNGKIGSFIWGYAQPELRNQMQRVAVEESRLGIPLIFGMDIIHGARTIFPIAPAMAGAFEPELLERAQAVAAKEARAQGLEWVFAPMCDLARDARWGRVAETCGEDPYLSALCNAAQVRGFQGDDPGSGEHLAACLKHYVGYSSPRGGRDYSDTEITEWTLRNAHLPSFHAAINAGALTVMSSFNAIGGIPAVANRHTLTEILREEWKFKGFVVSDWNAVIEAVSWGYAKDHAEAARLAICAGNDMDMLSTSYYRTLAKQIEDGTVPMAVVDEAVRRVLRVKFQVGLFDRPYVDAAAYESAILRPEYLALARESVVKSTVLLKNEGVLPLSRKIRKIALIGPFGDDQTEMLGCWQGNGEPKDVVTIASGLKDKFGSKISLAVVKGCSVSTEPRMKMLQDGSTVIDDSVPMDNAGITLKEAVSAAKNADVVIMAVGEPKGITGEGGSRATLTLTGRQQELFDAVARCGRPVVTIVFSGRTLTLPEVFDKSAAVLFAWQPGIQAGNGLADLISGDAAPSARLSMSVPYEVGQVPLYYNHYVTGRRSGGVYRDGVPTAARFWFGYGLTYTKFEYSDIKIVSGKKGKPAEAVAVISNKGRRKGVETVQLYIRQLACNEGARPMQELRGFKRVALKPGESAEVRFPLTSEVLGYVDRKGNMRVDKGDFHVWIAPHARYGEPLVYSHK